MGAYCTPPHPPRRAWRKLWLLLHLSREHRWAAAGLALALAMAVLLYLVMADNMVQIDNKRLAALVGPRPVPGHDAARQGGRGARSDAEVACPAVYRARHCPING